MILSYIIKSDMKEVEELVEVRGRVSYLLENSLFWLTAR